MQSAQMLMTSLDQKQKQKTHLVTSSVFHISRLWDWGRRTASLLLSACSCTADTPPVAAMNLVSFVTRLLTASQLSRHAELTFSQNKLIVIPQKRRLNESDLQDDSVDCLGAGPGYLTHLDEEVRHHGEAVLVLLLHCEHPHLLTVKPCHNHLHQAQKISTKLKIF